MAFCVYLVQVVAVYNKRQNKLLQTGKADGREYGEETTYSTEDTVQTAFFKVKVNSVTTQDEIQGENDEYTITRCCTSICCSKYNSRKYI